VLSLSADSLENAKKSATENGVEFPVAWGANPELFSKAVGAFYSPASAKMPAFVQSAGFVLGAGGKVLSATYSTGPIGRLVWQDALGFVEYVKSHG
jgi:peroxiredoxin